MNLDGVNKVIVIGKIQLITKYSDGILGFWSGKKKRDFAGKKTLGNILKILITDLHLKLEMF